MILSGVNQLIGDRFANVGRQRKVFALPVLANHMDLSGGPINIIEFEHDHLARPQSQSRQCEDHRVVAAPDGRIAVNAGE